LDIPESPLSNELIKKVSIYDNKYKLSDSSLLIVYSQGNLIYDTDLEIESNIKFSIFGTRTKEKKNSIIID